MAYELVRQRSRNPLEQQRIARVLEHAAVPLLLDVLDIFPRAAAGGILLAHVAEPAGEFRKPLAVGAVADPVDREMRGLHERGAREERDDRFGIEVGHCPEMRDAECGMLLKLRGGRERRSEEHTSELQ